MGKENRLDRLSQYRELKTPVGIMCSRSNGFYVEVSTKAIENIKPLKDIAFNVCHDWDDDKYWLVINGEGSDKKFDFTRVIQGNVSTSVNGWDAGKKVSIDFTLIDRTCPWGMIEPTMEMIADWLDRRYGEDYGFHKPFKPDHYDYAVNRGEEKDDNLPLK